MVTQLKADKSNAPLLSLYPILPLRIKKKGIYGEPAQTYLSMEAPV